MEVEAASTGAAAVPHFPPVEAGAADGVVVEVRKIRVPPNRYTPLKENWQHIMHPIVTHMKLQIRMNTRTRCVELKSSEHTADIASLQKSADFVQAFMMGFEVQDAVALLRIDDLFIDTFEVTDVKRLRGDHLSRAIGRIATVVGHVFDKPLEGFQSGPNPCLGVEQ